MVPWSLTLEPWRLTLGPLMLILGLGRSSWGHGTHPWDGQAGSSRNENNNRTANTIWTPAKADTCKSTVVKSATACREANYSRDTIIMRADSSSIDNRNIVDLNSNRTARISRKFSNSKEARNTCSKDASKIRDISRSRYSQA